MERLVSAAALLSIAGAPAAAAVHQTEAEYETVSASIALAGLDRDTASGVAEFERRLDVAAKKACGVAEYHDRAAQVAVSDCIRFVKSSVQTTA